MCLNLVVLNLFLYLDPKVRFGQDSLVKFHLFLVFQVFHIVSLTHMKKIVEMHEKDDF